MIAPTVLAAGQMDMKLFKYSYIPSKQSSVFRDGIPFAIIDESFLCDVRQHHTCRDKIRHQDKASVVMPLSPATAHRKY